MASAVSSLKEVESAPSEARDSQGAEALMLETDDEWQAWYHLTPQERWRESMKLWEFYLAVGGSLDPEPDSQSPFDADYVPRPVPADGRPGVRVLRRDGI